ncbi:low temperature requirement protein LtrA [Cellulosimicrobium cellulans J34]|nr:low temperature requirement protein LtrA [Cellulosimicrobium cellulans J34]
MFVVVVQQLARRLEGGADALAYVAVAALAVLVWMCWLNQTFLMNMAPARSGAEVVLTLASMAGVGVVAISLAPSQPWTPGLFALGYAVARVALWPLWRRVAASRPAGAWRETWATPTLFGPGLAVGWLASVLLPPPAVYVAWAVLVGVETVLLVQGLPRYAYRGDHLTERAELFVLVLLGDSIIELFLSVTVASPPAAWWVAAVAFVATCAVWALYFDLGARVPALRRDPSRTTGGFVRDVVVGAHLLLLVGLVLVAVGFRSAIEAAEVRPSGTATAACLGAGFVLVLLAQGATALRARYAPRWVAVWVLPGAVVAAGAGVAGASWPTAAVPVVCLGAVLGALATGYALVGRGLLVVARTPAA